MGSKVLILSGRGELPHLFKSLAREKGFETFTVGVKGITDKRCDFEIPFLGFVELENLLRELNNPYLVMLGKFEPSLTFAITQSLINRLKVLFGIGNFKRNFEIFKTLKEQTPSLLPEDAVKTFIRYMENKGFKFLPSEEIRRILRSEFATEGNLNGVPFKLEDHHWEFFKKAKVLADNDIAQTVVVKDKHIVAVEGIEGTNRTIERAYKLVGPHFTVIKVGRTYQDYRIDIPAVGLETLKLLKRFKVKALLLEADRVLIVNKRRFLEEAKKNRIAVIGLKL